MKHFIIKGGNALLDGFALLTAIIIFIAFVATASSMNIAIGLFVLFASSIIFILTFYLIYLFVDIRENLVEINRNMSEYLKIMSKSCISNQDKQEISGIKCTEETEVEENYVTIATPPEIKLDFKKRKKDYFTWIIALIAVLTIWLMGTLIAKNDSEQASSPIPIQTFRNNLPDNSHTPATTLAK